MIWLDNNVSEDLSASIFRVKVITAVKTSNIATCWNISEEWDVKFIISWL
jgi:hypothetical protein